MYTIRQILGTTLGLTMSGVRHELAGIQNTYDANSDGKIEKSEVLSAGKTAEQIKTNIAELQKIADDTGANSGDRAKAIEIKTVLETGLVEITKSTQSGAQDVRKDVGEAIIVGSEAQSKALLSLLGIQGNDTSKKIIEDLKDTNIQSLMTIAANYLQNKVKVDQFVSEKGRKAEFLIRDIGYTPNGSISFGGEIEKVQKFLQLVSTSPDSSVYSKLATYAGSGLAMTVAQKDRGVAEKLSDINSLVSYLSDVPTARYQKSDVQTVLTNLAKKPEDFVKAMNLVLGTQYVDITGFVSGLKVNPELKANFFNAINTNGANGVVGLDSFLRGKGADKARESTKNINKMLSEKVTQARQVMESQIAVEQDPTKKADLQKALSEFNAKGESAITGELRKVAEGAFVNIGRNANALGAGVTYEAFVKGLTVSVGGGVYDGKVAPGIVLHYNVAGGKVGETQGRIVDGNLGVGASVFPAFLPFVTAGVRGVEKVTSFGMDGRGLIDSVGVQTQLSKGGVVSLVFANERMNEMEQGRQKLADMVGKIANKESKDVTIESLDAIIKDMKLTVRSGESVIWVDKIQNIIRLNPGYDQLSPDARAVILMGLVNAEAEKAAIQEANNDKDARSFKGWSVGIGHILGVTFPVAGIMFKEGKVVYSHPKTQPTNAAAATPAVAPARRLVENLNFSKDGYDVSTDKKTVTFKDRFVPKTVNIDPKIGTYDAQKKLIMFEDSTTADMVVMTPMLSADKKSIDSLTIQLKSEATVGKAENIRGAQAGLDQRLQGVVYVLNRRPEYKTFNLALTKISNQDYTGGLTLLESFAKKDARIKTMLDQLGNVKSNPSLLSQLLTYTYGAEKVKNKNGTVNKTSYAEARKDTIAAEKRLGVGRWNEENETKFKDVATHRSTQLSALISEQTLSTSVFATPKDGTPRIDKFSGTIAVSDTISYSLNDAQKDALISEHSKMIESQLQILKDFVTKSGKSADAITIDQFKTMLKTDTIPAELKALGISFDKKPVFFEARAMASGNICMNKTEGIGYPTYSITREGSDAVITQDVPPPAPQVDSSYDPVGGNMNASEEVRAIGVSGYGEKKPKPEPEPEEPKPEPETTPETDNNGLINDPSITPPKPAPLPVEVEVIPITPSPGTTGPTGPR